MEIIHRIKNNKNSSILIISICLTLFIHTISLVQNIQINFDTFKQEEEEQKVILLKLVNDQLKNQKVRQIVESKQKNIEKKVDDSKFVSDANRAVDRETVAANVGKFQEAGQGVKHGDETKNNAAQARTGQKSKQVSLADLALDRGKLLDKMFQQKQVARPKLGLKTGKSKKAGLSRRSDYVEELPLGDFTKLNTVEYKYYGFFFRIKQKLEQFWGSNIQQVATKMFKQGRRLPANKHYITSLIINMDSNGKIIGVDVDSTSGVRELDGAAISSFNKAGPFPNPPKGLIKNGVATIRWKFAVDAN